MKRAFQSPALVVLLLAQVAMIQAQEALSVDPNGDVTMRKLLIGADANSNASLRVDIPGTNGIGVDIRTKNNQTTSIPLRVGSNKDKINLQLSNGGGIIFTADTINYSLGAAILPYYTNFKDGVGLKFCTRNHHDSQMLERMVIKPDGRIGIGETNPTQALLVVGSISDGQSRSVRYFNWNSVDIKMKSIEKASISATSNILATEFDAYSDARIKKDYRPSDGQADLAVLKQIKITDYRYKDAVKHGTAFKKGVLAQELEEVFPQAVSKHTDYITDIFSMPKQVSLMGTTLMVHMDKPHGLATGDMLRLITPETLVDTLVEVLDKQTFMVKNWTRATTSVFVYGKKVDDFRSVDFDRLTVLSVSALQQLCKETEALEQSVQALEARVGKLEKAVNLLPAVHLQK